MNNFRSVLDFVLFWHKFYHLRENVRQTTVLSIRHCELSYSDSLRAGRPGDRIPVGAVIQTGPGAHPVPYTMDTWSFPEVKRPERGADHPPHPAPRLKTE